MHKMSNVALVAAVVLLCVACPYHGVTSTTLDLFQMQEDLSGLGFSADLAFLLEGISDVSCARHCMMSSACLTFTYSAEGTRTCRGHSMIITSATPSFALPGSKVFIEAWHGRDCNSNSECSVVNSECFAGRCLCTPGYFYSQGGKNCLTECAPQDLQDTMVAYPAYDVSNSDLYAGFEMTLQQCQDMCFTHTWCLTLEHVWSSACFLKNTTALITPGAIKFPLNGAMHYQRTCM